MWAAQASGCLPDGEVGMVLVRDSQEPLWEHHQPMRVPKGPLDGPLSSALPNGIETFEVNRKPGGSHVENRQRGLEGGLCEPGPR